jgi:hypothetical protein
MLRGRNGHAHRLYLRQEFPVIAKIPGVQGVSHLVALVAVKIGHPHQLGFGQSSILFGVKPAQISHTNDTHFYRFGHFGPSFHFFPKGTCAPGYGPRQSAPRFAHDTGKRPDKAMKTGTNTV